MSGVSVTRDTYRITAPVPEEVVGMPSEDEGEWAVWQGLTSIPLDGRIAVVLVSIAVTPFRPRDPGDEIAARLRGRQPEGETCIEEFLTADGNPAVSVRRVVTRQVNGRDVTTGQAQALVAYPGAGALGVVSGVALDPADLDRAAKLVTGIAAGMTITEAPAAA